MTWPKLTPRLRAVIELKTLPCAFERLRRDAQPPAAQQPAPEELAFAHVGHRALETVHAQVKLLLKEPRHALHHPLARLLRLHVDVAVVGVAAEAMAALLEFLVQIVQHQVGQQGRDLASKVSCSSFTRAVPDLPARLSG